MSSQQAESFRASQEDYDLDLKMIQDVWSHWNSCFEMLIQANQVHDALEVWINDYDNSTVGNLAFDEQK